MKKFPLVVTFATAVAVTGVYAADDAIGNVGCVKLKGCLGARLDQMIERHVMGTDVDYITACFLEKTERRGWWQTEFWGKYMHSAIPYLAYCGSERLCASVDRGLARMIASQEPSGYIGNYPDELRFGEGWDVWGIKYTLLGFLHFYDYAVRREAERVKREARGTGAVEVELRADRVLEAAKRLCDCVIAEIGPGGKRGRELWQTGNWSGYASSSILEPVVWLYRRTGEKKYLDFATYVVEGMTKREKGPRLLDLALKGVSVADRNEPEYVAKRDAAWAYVCKYGRSKAYEMMSCYQGLLDYVEEKVKIEGEGERLNQLRRAAILTGEDIAKEEVNLAGGCACSEAWYHGAKKQHLPYVRLQETCVTTTWMRFCEKLLETTDDPKWADQIERTFYNAYLGALKPDGSMFAAYTPLSGNRWRGMDHCYMHTDCCTANGPRGFLCFLRELFRTKEDGAYVNFYASALLKGTMPKTGAKISFDMYSLYPRDGYVRLVSHTDAAAGEVSLKLRIPGWCGKMRVKVNGVPVETFEDAGHNRERKGYVVVNRLWSLGDVVEISMGMPVVAHRLDHHVAFTRGPVLLARDSRFNDGDLTEPFRKDIWDDRKADLGGGKVMPTFSEVRTPSADIWMAFSATLPLGSHHANPEGAKPSTVFFCDYASAGNEWRRGNFYRTWFPIEYDAAD